MTEENVKRVIKTFEDASSASYHNQNDQYSAQPMLKKWNERLKELTNERIVKHKTLTR